MASDQLLQKLRESIKRSELWVDRSREAHGKFSGLRCPECGQMEAWAYSERPFAIVCNRKNKCGARVKTLDLFPELLQNIERDFAPTREDPNRPAREYLRSRGLYGSLDGLRFEYWRDIRKTGSGGVVFWVGKNAKGVDVWNGRIFNPPPGESKSHNRGETAGMYWRHPALKYDSKQPTYVTEGVIDALSLIEMGYQAIAAISSGQDPGGLDLGDEARNLVIAFDRDSAGAGGLQKWRTNFPEARAIAPVSGDWNDLLCRFQSTTEAAEYFQATIEEFQAQATLLMAASAQAYAELYHAAYGRTPGLFEFEKAYYYATVKENNKFTEVKARKVSDFVLGVEYYQVDTTNEDEPLFRCCVDVRRNGNRSRKFLLSGTELATPHGMRKAMLDRALAAWEGGEWETKALARMVTHTKAPVVRQMYRTGHDEETGAFFFRTFAVDRSGRLVMPDPKGYFRLSSREFVAPARHLTLKPQKGRSVKQIYDLLQLAWPETGPLVFAFTVASWFTHLVKPELGFFPFLSIWGDTQTGKSRLVRVANALQGFDDEGLPLTKVNTAKGEMRKLAQRSSLFMALIEANREENTRFDFDVLLSMYNVGNPIRVTAVKTNDLQTQETPFLGSLMFAQNREQFKSKAQMERVVSGRRMLVDDITPQTRAAFEAIVRIPPKELAWTFVDIMGQRRKIEDGWLKAYDLARDDVMREVPDNRIAENHGVVLAFHRIIMDMMGINHDLFPYLVEIAANKRDKCGHREATPADHFFEVLDGLSDEDEGYIRYVEERDGVLYLRMAEALRAMDKKGVRFVVGALYQDLKEHPAFMQSNVCHKGYFSSTRASAAKVWKFQMSKL